MTDRRMKLNRDLDVLVRLMDLLETATLDLTPDTEEIVSDTHKRVCLQTAKVANAIIAELNAEVKVSAR